MMQKMTFYQVRSAIVARLKSFNGSLDKKYFRSENRPLQGSGAFVVPNNGVWVSWSINYGLSEIASIEYKPCVRNNGELVFQIFDRKGNGVSAIDTLADDLIDHFESYSVGNMEILQGSLINADDKDFEYKLLTFVLRIN